MNRIDLDNFYSETFQLVRTMVVKIEAIAKRDNQVLEKAGIEVGTDKRTWRYYMNLNGDYHSDDTLMTVMSLDTGELIPFTKESLATHLLTYRQYLRGGDLYKRLTEIYSGQTVLIRGILFPIDYDESINADNYKILRYNTDLVLWNEEQLIPETQRWINANAPDMFENEYHVTEDLLAHQMVVEFTSGILKVIHLTRFQAIKTRYAHDFYIWSHIDSFGELSIYKQSLNREQTMWLHRNIEWIDINAGKRFTFKQLLDNLLTKRRIPLAEYNMVLNTAKQLDTLTPEPQWRRTNLNLNDDGAIPAQFFDTATLIDKERAMAADNDLMSTIYREEAEQRGTYSLHSDIPTKVLESEMADYTNRGNETTMSVVMNEWIYLAGKGVYQVNMAVIDPKDGRQLRLSAEHAFILWRYLTQLARGIDLLVIENAYYQDVMRLLPPSVKELQDVGLGPDYITPVIANSIRNEFVDIVSVGSAEELLNRSLDIYRAMWNHKKLYSQYGDNLKRATVKNATKLMYESGEIALTDDPSYDRFLQTYALDFTEYTPTELTSFAWVIFKTFTGWDLNNNPSLRSIQADLIDLMMRLSSYTIHTVKTMEDGSESAELLVENNIGDSQYLGLGNQLVGDFSNLHLALSHALQLGGELTVDARLPQSDNMSLESSVVIEGNFRDTYVNDLIIVADGEALQIPNSDYFDLHFEAIPLDPVVIPPTFYGELCPQTEPDTAIIPPTFYGELGLDQYDNRIIPTTFYGNLGDKL